MCVSFPCVSAMLVIIAVMFMHSGCKLIENLHPELAMRGEESHGSKECGDCHIDIYKEWAESLHSKSYINEEFKVATNNYEYKFCMGCHVPETIFKSLKGDSADKAEADLSELKNEEIVARAYNLEDGVDCHGCHLTVDCTLAGPHSGISPHPIEEREEFYKGSELCGICHIDTLKEYLTYAGNGNDETCQDCHMPAVRRKLIQDEPWQKLHVKKEGKAHTFSRLSAIEKTGFIELKFSEVNNDNNQITGNVEIINTKVNHSIPTGKYGYREVVLLINIKDNIGRTIRSKQESMFVELNTQLKPGEQKIYSFVFDLDGKSKDEKELEATLFRTNFNRTEKTLLAKEKMKLRLPKSSQ